MKNRQESEYSCITLAFRMKSQFAELWTNSYRRDQPFLIQIATGGNSGLLDCFVLKNTLHQEDGHHGGLLTW